MQAFERKQNLTFVFDETVRIVFLVKNRRLQPAGLAAVIRRTKTLACVRGILAREKTSNKLIRPPGR